MLSGVDPPALRAARERADLTQHELARLVGAACGERISRWELGASQPRPEFVRRLSEALRVSPQALVRHDGDLPDIRALRLCRGLRIEQVTGRSVCRERRT